MILLPLPSSQFLTTAYLRRQRVQRALTANHRQSVGAYPIGIEFVFLRCRWDELANPSWNRANIVRLIGSALLARPPERNWMTHIKLLHTNERRVPLRLQIGLALATQDRRCMGQRKEYAWRIWTQTRGRPDLGIIGYDACDGATFTLGEVGAWKKKPLHF